MEHGTNQFVACYVFYVMLIIIIFACFRLKKLKTDAEQQTYN